MGRREGSFPHGAKIGVFLVGLVLALSIPAFAFAANTAVFSGAAPKPGSSTGVSTPKISVTVYDKYGSSGFYGAARTGTKRMWLDGARVPQVISYVSGWGNKKFKLTYQVPSVPSPLSLGVHTAMVKIHDLAGHDSTYSWSFTVIDTAPPVTTTDALPGYDAAATIHLFANDNVGGSGVAHTYYMLDGALPALYSSGIAVPRPHTLSQLHWLEFWSVDVAGNVEAHHVISFTSTTNLASLHALPDLACTVSGCHDTTLMAIHLDRCSRCHTGAELTNNCITCHGENPPNHNPHVAITSTSDPACTTCHGTNVSTIHQSCTVCHGDSDFDAIIAAGGAHCETCHTDSYGTIHATDAHDVPGSNTCSTAVCHTSADAVTIHAPGDGCVDCHDPTSAANRNKVTSMATCGTTPTCHGADINTIHSILPASHVSPNSCALADGETCHVSNVATIHTTQLPGGPTPPGCAACHAVGVTPSTDCAATGCHDGVTMPLNPHAAQPAVGASHNAATNSYWSGCSASSDCHAVSSDVSVIHSIWAGAPGCVACHTPSRTPSVDCFTAGCHPADFHGVNQTTKHTFTDLPSACAACHSNNLQTEHFGNYGGLSCATCHQNTDARVMAAIADGVNTCIACHSGTGTDTNLNSDYHGFEFLNPANASGHNVTGGASIGAKTMFNGSQGPLLVWESEMASATLNAQYAAATGLTSLSIGQTGTVQTVWSFPTVNVFWASGDASAAPTAITGLTSSDTIGCNDCHDAAAGIQATGPHGSTQSWAIDPNYPGDFSRAELTKQVNVFASGIKMRSDYTTATQTYTDGTTGTDAVICAKCHDLENYKSGTTLLTPLPLISVGSASWVYNGETYTPVFTSGSRGGWTVFTDSTGHMVPSIPGTSTTPPGATSWTQSATGTVNINAIGASNTAHASHHQDQTDGSPQCVNCHVAIPHGWTAPRLLVNSGKGTSGLPTGEAVVGDSAPYLSPMHLGTTQTGGSAVLYRYIGGAWVQQAPGTGGFNRIGMLYLSGVDQHTLVNGAALWSEPSCAGCGDHTGESEVGIGHSGSE